MGNFRGLIADNYNMSDMGWSRGINTFFLLPKEKTIPIKIDGRPPITLKDIALYYQGETDEFHIEDNEGRLIQPEDIKILSELHHANPRIIMGKVRKILQQTSDDVRANAIIEALLNFEISRNQACESLIGNSSAIINMCSRLISKETTKTERYWLLPALLNVMETVKNNSKLSDIEEEECANVVRKLSVDSASSCTSILLLLSNPSQRLANEYIENEHIRENPEIVKKLSRHFSWLYSNPGSNIEEGLKIARDLFNKTGSPCFLAHLSLHLENSDFKNILESMYLNRDNPNSDFWTREQDYLLMIAIEASLRPRFESSDSILNLAIVLFDEQHLNNFLQKAKLSFSNLFALESRLKDETLSDSIKYLMTGCRTAILPHVFSESASAILENNDVMLTDKTQLLLGLRGIKDANEHSRLKKVIFRELRKLNNEKFDVQFTKDELNYVIASREVLIDLEGDNLTLEKMREFLDPIGELDRRLRARGPRGHVEQINEGVLETHYYSEFGFIAQDETIDEIVARDTMILEKYGLSFAEVAFPMRKIREYYFRTKKREFEITINNQTYHVKKQGPIWVQSSPFVDSTNNAEADFLVTNIESGKTFFFFGLLPYLIEYHHFFEGNIGTEDTCYRIEPKNVIEFFNIQN